MIATLVGTGTLVPHPRRSTPSYHIEEEDLTVSLDGGSGSLRRQAELGFSFASLDWLCFTHVHPDHTLDLLHFLFAMQYGSLQPREEPVRILGPKGFQTFLDHFRSGIRSWTEGGPQGYEVTEVTHGDVVDLGGLHLEAVELYHSVTNMGYRISTREGRVLAFTGDTAPGDNLQGLARDADVLIAECSALESEPMEGHLTAADAGRLAQSACVKQLVLSHLYPLPDDRARLAEARTYYQGPVLLAGDGDRFLV